MSEENRCPECGAPLPAHAPQGLCPGCLLKRGIETAPPASEEAGQASGDFTPPTPEQLAASSPTWRSSSSSAGAGWAWSTRPGKSISTGWWR